MKVLETIFKFRGWTFSFTPGTKKKMNGRYYTKWDVIVGWRGKKYKAQYYSFVPSAFICRVIKKNKHFLNNPVKGKQLKP